jgi:hypothetical protein
MKKLATYALCLLIAVAPACRLTEAQRESGRIALNDAYDRGEITAAQRDAAVEGLESGNVDWTELATVGGSILASILLGVPVAVGVSKRSVRKERGPVNPQQAAKQPV